MTQKQKNNNQEKENSIHTTRLYIVLSIISVIIMIFAAYITYGENYQSNSQREIHVSLKKNDNVQKKETSDNTVSIGTDLSKVPNDDVIEDILNDAMPNVCDECGGEPIDCLDEYEINKVLVQAPEHKDHLFVELITGDNEVFKVVIDLNNDNSVLNIEGEIDDSACRDAEVNLGKGNDSESSKYINVKPR